MNRDFTKWVADCGFRLIAAPLEEIEDCLAPKKADCTDASWQTRKADCRGWYRDQLPWERSSLTCLTNPLILDTSVSITHWSLLGLSSTV